MQHGTYLTVNPGLLVGKLLDLYDGHDLVNMSANTPSHILSIILYADRGSFRIGADRYLHIWPTVLINSP